MNKMEVNFTSQGWEDYIYWSEFDKKILKKINTLIKDVSRNPFQGLGKPEPLKHEYSGYWSRRIDEVHRLVYAIESGKRIVIIKCRYHY
ncbi:MAG: Txe/YoeB family addiction module toxin [Rickettsiales bacterium]|nr:Txe/YoeB family addiction module toxin [Rickettsiales bacterium]